MKKYLIPIGIVFIVVAVSFYLFSNKASVQKGVDEVIDLEGSEAQAQLQIVKNAYNEKVNLIEVLIKANAFKPTVANDLQQKIKFIQFFELSSQYEFDQFEYLQRDFSMRLRQVFEDKESVPSKAGRTQLELEKIEQKINLEREKYNLLASEINLKRSKIKNSNSKEISVFKSGGSFKNQ